MTTTTGIDDILSLEDQEKVKSLVMTQSERFAGQEFVFVVGWYQVDWTEASIYIKSLPRFPKKSGYGKVLELLRVQQIGDDWLDQIKRIGTELWSWLKKEFPSEHFTRDLGKSERRLW